MILIICLLDSFVRPLLETIVYMELISLRGMVSCMLALAFIPIDRCDYRRSIEYNVFWPSSGRLLHRGLIEIE